MQTAEVTSGKHVVGQAEYSALAARWTDDLELSAQDPDYKLYQDGKDE